MIKKNKKKIAELLRKEAILPVPPPLPPTLITAAFYPASLKVSSSRKDVAVVVAAITSACEAQLEECVFTPGAGWLKINNCQSLQGKRGK